jgi:hypothetical protein
MGKIVDGGKILGGGKRSSFTEEDGGGGGGGGDRWLKVVEQLGLNGKDIGKGGDVV